MPLFECEQCHVTENTACCNFWMRLLEKKPLLCSECDPEIGEWHGEFPRTPAVEYRAKHGVASIRYPEHTHKASRE